MLKSGIGTESRSWLLIACLLAGGCRSSVSPLGPTEGSGKAPAAPAASDSKAASSTRAVSQSAPGAIPEAVLNEHGLTTLWTKQPAKTEGAIRNVYLLPEGLFAVTRPDPEVKAWRLIRYDLETGLPKWFYELEDPLEYAPVAYHYGPSPTPRPDELYVLQKDVIRCLDLQYGADMWRVRLRFPVSSGPVVDEKQFYLGSYDRNIYAMPKKTGYDSWTYITGGEVKSPGTIGEGGHLYFTSTDKFVYRLEPSNGWVNGKSWRFATGGRILGSPVFFSRWIFVGSTDFKLYCFEMDGSRAWEFPAEAAVPETPVVMSVKADKPMVFCISQEARGGKEKRIAWALDAKTGQTQWHRDHVAQVVAMSRKAVYLLPDTRAVAGGRRLTAVDPLKGDELFSLPVEHFDFIPTNDAEHGTNVRTRGVVYLVSKTGLMQAVREKP